jgi:hypothetical protein
MSSSLDVLDALKAVEETRSALKNLAQSKPDDWVKQYALLRASLGEKMGRLSASGSAWFRERRDTAGDEKFSELLAASKTAMERHQARWPVVVIDHNNPEYLNSMAKVDACTTDVGRFIRAKVAR